MKPGSIIRFCNRDRVLLPSDREEVVLLGPLTGTGDDAVAVHRRLAVICPPSRLNNNSPGGSPYART